MEGQSLSCLADFERLHTAGNEHSFDFERSLQHQLRGWCFEPGVKRVHYPGVLCDLLVVLPSIYLFYALALTPGELRIVPVHSRMPSRRTLAWFLCDFPHGVFGAAIDFFLVRITVVSKACSECYYGIICKASAYVLGRHLLVDLHVVTTVNNVCINVHMG